MKLFAVLVGALALVAGLAGGLRAYSASSQAGPPIPTAQVSRHPAPQVVRPGPVLAWAPCVRPAVRVGRACVTRVTRTVTLPPPAASTSPSAPSAGPSSGPRATHTPRPKPSADPSTDTSGDDDGTDDNGTDDNGGDNGNDNGGDDGGNGGTHHGGGGDD